MGKLRREGGEEKACCTYGAARQIVAPPTIPPSPQLNLALPMKILPQKETEKEEKSLMKNSFGVFRNTLLIWLVSKQQTGLFIALILG